MTIVSSLHLPIPNETVPRGLTLKLIGVMPPEMQVTGGDAVVARTVRRTPPGSHDPTIKNLQWGDLTRGLIEAHDRGSTYPFLTDGDTNLTEGSGYNIVFIKDNMLYTADRGVLEGVTRKSVFDVARANDIEVRCEVVPVEMAYKCDEIFMCTTAGGVMPITKLDGEPVKDGKVGPVTQRIWDGYWAMHWENKYSFAVDYGKVVSEKKVGDKLNMNGAVDGLTNGQPHAVVS
jgi:branched-subunit amino acid aminotransferase/4-amino-4-deoxychorismate lyase